MRVDFERMNWESECMYDLINHRGFLITEPPFSDVDKQIKNIHGPRSPLYGSQWDSTADFAERYRCPCGRTIGSAFVGEKCTQCGGEVKDRDIDILYTGYISFSKYKIINPLWYHRMQSALSKKILEGIISNENIITSQGIIRKHNEVIEVKKSNMIYWNIG